MCYDARIDPLFYWNLEMFNSFFLYPKAEITGSENMKNPVKAMKKIQFANCLLNNIITSRFIIHELGNTANNLVITNGC